MENAANPVAGNANAAAKLAEPAQGEMVAYDRWLERAPALRAEFAGGTPTRHLVLDDFLDSAAAARAVESFPEAMDDWIHYLHYNERQFGLSDLDALPPALRQIVEELSSERFVHLLEELTGMQRLRPDSSLEGGGLHRSERGGYLNLHADFTVHPHRPRWRRALNLLIYLNPDWQDDWGGHLELWDSQLRSCGQRISPDFNRAVLFHTHEGSYHGFPDPLRCPPGVTRKALALYYFTEEAAPLRPVATRYRARPGDGLLKRTLILCDVLLLRVYDRAKRSLGLDDSFANRVLRKLAGR